MVYLILFITALISATLFPLGSEALLIYDIRQGYNIYLLLFFATFGNSLGSVLNYFFGLKGEEYLLEKRLVNENHIIKGKFYFDKYGPWIILLSWLPIIGDSITFIAGVLKYNFRKFLIFVIIAKFSRYLFLFLVIN